MHDPVGIMRTVIELFVATDERNWNQVEACFAEKVIFDMTSIAGGEPQELTGQEIAKGWRTGLQAIDHVHHQVSNFLVDRTAKEANVSCYGIAYHHRNIPNPDNTRTFVGTYDIHLVKTSAGWRIDRFRFNLKFITGNAQLESA